MENNNKNKCSSICAELAGKREQYLACLRENNEELLLKINVERLELEKENERLEKELKNLRSQRQKSESCPKSPYELETPLYSQLLTKARTVVKEL